MNTKKTIISIFFCFYHFLNHPSEKKHVTFALIQKIHKIDQYDGPASDLWYSEEDESVARKEFFEEKALNNQILNVSNQLQNVSLSEKNEAQENEPKKPEPIKRPFFGFDNKK